MRDALAAIGTAYRWVWEALYRLSQPWVLWAGLLVIGGWYALPPSRPSAALPYLFLWGLVIGGARLLINGFLPLPPARRAAPLPGERRPPPAQLAVIVVPPCRPEACPDRAEMLTRLPAGVRELIR